jgi:AcrR family transcriptional regulator
MLVEARTQEGVGKLTERSTRERLIAAAIDLFGSRGFAETSVQSITSAAGANLASVNYHFGSKEGLLRAAIHRVIDPVNAEQLRRLDGLEESANPPETEQIVAAFLEPFFDLLPRDTPEGRAAGRLMGNLLSAANVDVRAIALGEVAPVAARFVEAIGRSCPDLSRGELTRRFQSMMGALIVHQLGIGDAAPFFPSAEEEEIQRWILHFVMAGFLAPPTADERVSVPGRDG